MKTFNALQVPVPTELVTGDAEGIAVIPDFTFQHAPEQQHELKVHYITSGTPKYNRRGQLINAVYIAPPFGGTAAATYRMWGGIKARIVGPNRLINTNEVFVIFLDTLGIGPNTSKPSDSTFKHYSIEDLATVSKRVLEECFRITRLKMAIGSSLGSQMLFPLAYLFPKFIDTIVPIGTTIKIKNDINLEYGKAYYKLSWMEQHLKETESRLILNNTADCENKISKAMRNAWSMLLYGEKDEENLSPEMRELGPDRLINLVAYKDLVARLNVVLNYDVTNKIRHIRTRTFIGYITNDSLFSSRSAFEAQAQINKARMKTVVSVYGAPDKNDHMGCFINGPLICSELQSAIKERLYTNNSFLEKLLTLAPNIVIRFQYKLRNSTQRAFE